MFQEADFYLNNGEYITAANIYDSIYKQTNDLNTKVESLYCVGLSYYCYALHSPNPSEVPNYYNMALDIYREIITSTEFIKQEYYDDAIIDTASIYFFLDYSCENEDWVSIINYLEHNYDFSNIDNLNSTDVSLYMKVALALGEYYEKLHRISIEKMMDASSAQKTLLYYEAFVLLDAKNAEFNKKEIFSEGNSVIYIKIADFLTNYVVADPYNGIYHLNNALVFCQRHLQQIDTNKDIEEYIQLKKNIGKCYYILGNLYKVDQDYNMRQAYDELMPLVYWHDENIEFSLMDIGTYAIRTGLCSNNDIDEIITRYEYLMEQYSIGTNTEAYIKIACSACTACLFMAQNYDYSERAFKLGRTLINELNNALYDLLDEDNKMIVQSQLMEYDVLSE